MSNGIKCPLCDSLRIRHEKRDEEVSDHYQGSETISLNYDICEECGMDGDFANTNDALIRESMNRQRDKVVKTILQELLDQGVNFAGFERALELPQRTLSKWKNGPTIPTAAGVTLLKFLRMFPWLTTVADCNFTVNTHLIAKIITDLEKMCPRISSPKSFKTVSPVIIDAEYTAVESPDKNHYQTNTTPNDTRSLYTSSTLATS